MKNYFFLLLVFFITYKSYSLEVTLTQGTVKPTPIAVTDFYSKDNKVKIRYKDLLFPNKDSYNTPKKVERISLQI